MSDFKPSKELANGMKKLGQVIAEEINNIFETHPKVEDMNKEEFAEAIDNIVASKPKVETISQEEFLETLDERYRQEFDKALSISSGGIVNASKPVIYIGDPILKPNPVANPKSKPKSKRGFAALPTERLAEISKKGGLAMPNEARAFSKNRELAREAGRKGGLVSRIGSGKISKSND